MSKKIIFIFLSIFIIVTACSSIPYKRTLRAWTRQQNIYSFETLAARVLWHATYLSPEFKDTAIEKVNEWKKLPPGEMGVHAEYLMSNESGTFLISIYTPRSYPSLTADTDNFWEFTLDLPTGESLVPSSIESVRVTPREQRLFPYVNRWSKFYWVKFPASNLQAPFTLTLRSAGVTSFLDW
jgi:hypothetical protein